MGWVDFTLVLAMALVSGAIAALIWTTVYLNSRRNGWILLAVLVFLGVSQMINAFQLSFAAGLVLLVIYASLALLSVRRISMRQTKETSGN
ncbi:hypothetical protein [Bhargavaea massiliensis]|uniref:hypothetical protein n=1 Tax=Bhargavaea massiliensis TaxID=2697500 RepID=UPI001BCB18A9|nr:hypothetical protein [Bhargavaea massiliensis]